MSRRLRPALESDVAELIELARRSWLSAFAQSAPFPLIAAWAQADRTTGHYRRHWRDMLVLEEGSALLGLVQPQDDEINGLWVHPLHQGKGVGTELLRAGERVIREAGHELAWLHCSAFNPRALHFYRSRGYAETGRTRSTHAAGFEIEDVRMERRLA